MKKINIAITGYSSLSLALAQEIEQQEEMELVAIFSNQSPEQTLDKPELLRLDRVGEFKNQVDVLVVCSDSQDTNNHSLNYIQDFNLVEQANPYSNVALQLQALEETCRLHHHTAVIGVNWNPGVYSFNQILAENLIPDGVTYSFVEEEWSDRMSQIIESMEGVLQAKAYLQVQPDSQASILSGQQPQLKLADYYQKKIYLVIDEQTDPEMISSRIKQFPQFISQEEVDIHFIDQAEMDHLSISLKKGRLIRTGSEGVDKLLYHLQVSLSQAEKIEARYLLAFARAVYRMNQKGLEGAFVPLDVPASYLSPLDRIAFLNQYYPQ